MKKMLILLLSLLLVSGCTTTNKQPVNENQWTAGVYEGTAVARNGELTMVN